MLLKGKTALITGASRGIGKAILKSLMESGATVLGTATSAEGAEKITQFIKDSKGQGEGFVLNMGDKQSIDAMMESIKQKHENLDILVNNAGITRDNLLMRMKDDEWNDVINTNLSGIFYLTKACIRPMMKQRWGRIICISSISGMMGNPGQCNYAAAKAGLIGFTKSLAKEIGSRGITVNAVAPGFITTDMTDALPDEIKKTLLDHIPVGRYGDPEEIAAAVQFLASPQASYVTGTVINASGGLYM